MDRSCGDHGVVDEDADAVQARAVVGGHDVQRLGRLDVAAREAAGDRRARGVLVSRSVAVPPKMRTTCVLSAMQLDPAPMSQAIVTLKPSSH